MKKLTKKAMAKIDEMVLMDKDLVAWSKLSELYTLSEAFIVKYMDNLNMHTIS